MFRLRIRWAGALLPRLGAAHRELFRGSPHVYERGLLRSAPGERAMRGGGDTWRAGRQVRPRKSYLVSHTAPFGPHGGHHTPTMPPHKSTFFVFRLQATPRRAGRDAIRSNGEVSARAPGGPKNGHVFCGPGARNRWEIGPGSGAPGVRKEKRGGLGPRVLGIRHFPNHYTFFFLRAGAPSYFPMNGEARVTPVAC
jgi:hypothetical protein